MKPQEKAFIVVGTTAMLLAAGIGGGYLFLNKGDDGPSASVRSTTVTSTSSPASTTPSSPSTSMGMGMRGYKDGSYSSTVSYDVPHGGSNSVSAKITITGGRVASVTVNDNYTDDTSQAYVSSFENDVKSSIVGQSIANLSPSRIGGASLTTYAFDQVLDTIRSQAQA